MLYNPLRSTLGSLTAGEAISFENLAMFPLEGPDDPGPGYLTLDEALARGEAEVTEVSEAGSVPHLAFWNRGEVPVLLLDGETLVGAKQNRVLNLTILAPGKARTTIPVSCVERGRWSFRSRSFESNDSAMFARARASKMEQVSESLRASGEALSDQGMVWSTIESKHARMRVHAPTESMTNSFDSRRADIDGFVAALKPVARQRGAVFAIDGKIVGLELFDRAESFAKLAGKVVRSYALDALETPKGNCAAVERGQVLEFLEKLGSAQGEVYPATGLGEDLRISKDGMHGAALRANGKAVHVAAFAD